MFKYFTLEELCQSETAVKRNIENLPSFEVVDNMKVLVKTVLDPLREAWGSAIDVTSGFRNEALNKAVGGARTSAHPTGWVVDLVPRNGKIEEFFGFVVEWLTITGKEYDQVIDERDRKGNRWVHLALYDRNGRQRQEIHQLLK